jgi:hypothetical protein
MPFSMTRDVAVHEAIEALYPEVEKHAAYFRDWVTVSPMIPRLQGLPSATDNDHVFCALAIRAATTKRALFRLATDGDGDTAMVLARVILENAVLMAWMLKGQGRVRLETYILFGAVLSERLVEIVEKYYADNAALLAMARNKTDPYARAIASDVFGGRDDTWAYFPNPDKPGRLKRVTKTCSVNSVRTKKRPSRTICHTYGEASSFTLVRSVCTA